jgi:hypothetical protein
MVLGLTTGVAQSERSVIDSLLLNTVPVANKGGLEVLVPSTSGYGFQQAVNVGRIPEGGRVPYGLVHHPQQGSTVIDGFVKSGAAFGAAVNVVHGKRISKFKGARQRVLARLEKIEAARTREVEREAAVPAVWEEEFDL